MKKNLFAYLVIGGIVLVIALFAWNSLQPGRLDAFASCLGERGATFYGAFWCPHCQEQKRLFGNSDKNLPYVECSTPDRQGQTQVCVDANIQSYPTWEFEDGSRLTGVVPLGQLAEKTGCELPEGVEGDVGGEEVSFTPEEIPSESEENDAATTSTTTTTGNATGTPSTQGEGGENVGANLEANVEAN